MPNCYHCKVFTKVQNFNSGFFPGSQPPQVGAYRAPGKIDNAPCNRNFKIGSRGATEDVVFFPNTLWIYFYEFFGLLEKSQKLRKWLRREVGDLVWKVGR